VEHQTVRRPRRPGDAGVLEHREEVGRALPAGSKQRYARPCAGHFRSEARKLKIVSQFQGAKRVFGEKLEWHVTDGKVQSAVLRVWKASDREQDYDRELQQLEVYVVGKGKTCLIATVDAAQPDANAKAAAYAEEAVRSPCITQ
jgi:hypothetical protein